jgi:hypothetical protein
MWNHRSSGNIDLGCGSYGCVMSTVFLAILGLVLWFGGACLNYILSVWFDKTLPLWQASIAALFLGELPIVGAVITWILVAIGAA